MAENNFAKERRDWLPIFMREVLQNALDARRAQDAPVKVTLSYRELDPSGRKYVDSVVPREHLDRYVQSVPHSYQNVAPITDCLVVEDFGTTGLTGVYDDPDKDGAGQNWNAFWFREGEGGKEGGTGNGGAGQGKITYFSTSGLRTIFCYTIRQDDGKAAIFGASSFLRDYVYGADDRKWKRDAYWGTWHDRDEQLLALPVLDSSQISAFVRCFGLKRAPQELGTSLIIPEPKAFDDTVAVQITLAEFFIPILRGDLVVRIGDIEIDKSNVCAIADARLSDERARELDTCTTKGFREFMARAIANSSGGIYVVPQTLRSASEVGNDCFTAEQLVGLREALNDGQVVSVRFMTAVKPKSKPAQNCSFDVHVMLPVGLERPEQAVIRRDLLIGDEPVGAAKLRQRARGLTLIRDDELSKLLLNAEEATHLRWNTRLPRLGEYYKDGPPVVALVRNAMGRLLDLLLEGDQQRDFKLLSKYFSMAGSSLPNKARGKRARDGKQTPIDVTPPPPVKKLLSIEALTDGCRVRASSASALSGVTLPLPASIDFAYEGIDKDAFAEYDPMDFDLAEADFVVEALGCTITKRFLNRVELVVTSPHFDFSLRGFDRNLRLRMRLKYEETENAAPVDAE